MRYVDQWANKIFTISDKTARQQYGLTQDEIEQGIADKQLQARQQYMHGNPWIRLLRSEVEELVKNKRGEEYLKALKIATELELADKEIKLLTKKLKELNLRKEKLNQGIVNLEK